MHPLATLSSWADFQGQVERLQRSVETNFNFLFEFFVTILFCFHFYFLYFMCNNAFFSTRSSVYLQVEEKGGAVEAERAEVERSKNIVVVYADHPFIILVQSEASKAFHLMGAFKRPWGRIRSHDEL